MLRIPSQQKFSNIREFQIIESQKVGCGSFGTVKLARHRSTCRMYALKIVIATPPRSTFVTCPPRQRSNSFRDKYACTPLSTTLTSSNCGTPSSKETPSI